MGGSHNADLIWQTTGKEAIPYAPHGQHGNSHAYSDQWTHKRTGFFRAKTSADCVMNQNCGLLDVGRCHDCDTEQECRDLGISSTVFVTHHRKYMNQPGVYDHISGKRKRLQYHCKKEGDQCKCTCDGHKACMAHKGKMITNAVLHANVHPHIPKMQDCCNLCTNHPQCGSWEYSSTNICVLKKGAPVFVDQPSASFDMWSGCRAGETC